MTYNEIIQKAGKQLERELQTSEDVILKNDDIESIKISFNAPLVGTVMKQFEVVTKKEITKNINTVCTLKLSAIYGEYKANKVYSKLYIKEKPTYNADERTYTYILGDVMILTMQDYKPVNITYPTTIGAFTQALIGDLGLLAGFTSDTMPNHSILLEKDPYSGISNFTYRDALDDIAQANGVLFEINNNAKIGIVDFKNRTPKVINDDILKNQNISMGEHYGDINTLVLSRSAESDNIYYPDPLPENPVEYKIIDNILMNGDNRADFMPAILKNIEGVEYDIFDCELVGYGDFEPLDSVKIETLYNDTMLVYNSYVFNYEVDISDGYSEAIYTEMPNNTNTDYKTAGTDDRMMKSVKLVVDKQNGTISAIAKDVEEIVGSEKTVNLKDYYGKITNVDIDGVITFKKSIEKDMVGVRECNYMWLRIATVYNPYDHPDKVVYEEKLTLPDTMYFHGDDYIEYSIDGSNSIWNARYHTGMDTSSTIKEISWSGGKITNPASDELYILMYLGADASSLVASIGLWNIKYKSTGELVTQVQLKSAITQSASEINLSVEGKLEPINGDIETIQGDLTLKVDKDDNNQVVSMLNASANEINLTSNRFSMTSDYSSIKKNGEVEFKGGTVGGWHINETTLYCEIKPPYDYTAADRDKIQQYIEGKITLTDEERKKYDINNDGIINIIDLNLCNKLITYNFLNSNPGKLILDTSDWFKPIKIVDSNGDVLAFFGVNGIWTRPL